MGTTHPTRAVKGEGWLPSKSSGPTTWSSGVTVHEAFEAPPFAVVADTREPEPGHGQWAFSYTSKGARVSLPVERAKLDVGDYAIKGVDGVAIERKSLQDWYGSLFGGTTDALGERAWNFDRLVREFERAAGYRFFAVFVEGSRRDAWLRSYRGDARPEQFLGKSDSIYLDHKIPVFWLGDAAEAQRTACSTFRSLWKRHAAEAKAARRMAS